MANSLAAALLVTILCNIRLYDTYSYAGTSAQRSHDIPLLVPGMIDALEALQHSEDHIPFIYLYIIFFGVKELRDSVTVAEIRSRDLGGSLPNHIHTARYMQSYGVW